ncbi:ABC transporter substrate-binding protein [Jiella endophytica]|uniref:ABC transporter substrate-binding protein n=1 Tax=Jiella endophytica TaxID=2558362 RepID=A0A4Y8RPI7_9HYPH|nr:ABC transporter substrate-binding protein [Jiella endophytica]TFF25499.1 ABC transporter substrate-binding protein [Jiella endophytica]
MPDRLEFAAHRIGGLRAPAILAAVLCGLTGLAAALPSPARAEAAEPKYLAGEVAKGELPPMSERLPSAPRVLPVDSPCAADDLGGTLDMLAASAKDTRIMPVFGYARLVGYDTKYRFVPDILESFQVEGGRIFTFHLRPGMKWSDGEPFTAEDFRYFWEDMAKNPKIAKFGIPPELLVDGEEPEVTFPDDYTVRYAWPKPNPGFLASLAAATPFDIYRPAHYLKKYNPNYTDPKKVEAKVEKSGQRNWVALHFKKDRAQRNDNPDMPTLQPWMLVTKPPSERLIFARNPYFFRVDEEGRQLPYLDEVALTIANSGLIPAKVANGEADLQAAYLSFPNYPFLKRGEKRSHYDVRRWKSGKGAHVALYPNLNAKDPVWRKLLQTADFRRALSLAINRKDINQAIFYGLAETGGNTVLPGSPFFDEKLRSMWSTYEPDRANEMLDALGLKRDSPDGLRHLPDGREMRIVVETAGESREQSDVLQLIRDDWEKIGIELLIRESQREIFRNRIKAGSTLISVWTGLDNGLATPDSDPGEIVPSTAEQLEWPGYGMWVETHGSGGEEPGEAHDLDPLRKLIELRKDWRLSLDEAQKTKIWREALAIFADQVFTIGVVSGVDQIVVVSDKLENVPQQGVYNYDPGAFFGIYNPDTFYFACPAVDTADRRP